MKVAVIGATGSMGRALAKQLSRKNDVVLGSRDEAKAIEMARGMRGAKGAGYKRAAGSAEMAILAIPYSAIGLASGLLEELAGKVVISTINPLKAEGGKFSFPLSEGSAAEELAGLLPKSNVATAFNHVSSIFFEKDMVVPMDVLVAADGKGTYEAVAGLVSSIQGLRPLYAGQLSESRTIEMLTPMLLNLSKLNRTGSLSTRFVSAKDLSP